MPLAKHRTKHACACIFIYIQAHTHTNRSTMLHMASPNVMYTPGLSSCEGESDRTAGDVIQLSALCPVCHCMHACAVKLMVAVPFRGQS